MNLIFFDCNKDKLLPLTFTRPVADLRTGTLTFAQRWAKLLGSYKISYLTETYLQEKFTLNSMEENYFINSSFIPNESLIESIKSLKSDQAIYFDEHLISYKGSLKKFEDKDFNNIIYHKSIVKTINYTWDLFSINYEMIEFDFNLLTKNRKSQEISSTNIVIGNKDRLFIEPGANIECCTFNTKEGSIYIGENADIKEGSNFRGPISIGDNSIVNMGAKIYGGTTIGPSCKVGGEINNSIIWGFSSKGHNGYLGNSVIGQWCNLGADTNTSNLKNNYDIVKSWSFKDMKFISTGLQFCGTIMGDHSKTAINTQLNTGTTIGVFANIFISGFPPNIIHNFAWGGERSSPKFTLDKSYEIAHRVMQRRNIKFDLKEKQIIEFIFNH